jgi:uncharacterized membrane protein SpoIIM required for sporulation/ABC-type transport system involved in multi-copper enzyme maturation permease subunit
MNLAPVRLIARREIHDTLTDWRILAPTFILIFLLPLLLISAANFMIDFVDDPNVISRLIPFVMLLIGFIPASFSIITALESFVGERERNSLEALLAMPISDNELYLGKLISSLLPPLMSAYSAMCVFAIALRTFYPDLYFSGLDLQLLIIIFLLITGKAVVMVAGAIIISSHTTSIRAANLLASFVLLPTAAVIQIEAIFFIGGGRGITLLQQIVLLLAIIATALVRTGMGAFNREEILSREHEQLNLKRIRATFMTFVREYRPAGVAPDTYRGLPLSAQRFYREELPALLREYRLPLAVALIAALVGLIGGSYVGQVYRLRELDSVLANVGSTPDPGLPLALYIFFNNIRVSILSNVFSLFAFGTFAFLVPAVAFTQVGFVASALGQRNNDWFAFGADSPLQFLVAYVLPHGIIELPAAILGAALGLRIGAALMSPPKGFTVGQNILWAFAQYVKVWLFVLLPMFFVGSMIEGLLTPLIVRSLY